MEPLYRPEEGTRIAEARMSFSGLLLTDRQFDEVIALTGVLHRRIEETGSFKDCLNDYANALARTERFDAVKADTMIRDLYKIRFAETMNETRERLMKREEALFDRKTYAAEHELQKAYQAVMETGQLVEHGTKMTFHRAQAHEATGLARDLGITHTGAKRLMDESFKSIEGADLRVWGKELDERYYRPQIEAEKSQRDANRKQARTQQPSFS